MDFSGFEGCDLVSGPLLLVFHFLEKIYFILSCFYFIFSNLGIRKEGEMSAYSVFNKGFKKLPGTFSAEEMFKGKSSFT